MTATRGWTRTYRNPVYAGYFADPFVLAVDDGYVAYGTGSVVDGRAFEVLTSPDLIRWTSVGGALERSPQLGPTYWAPEVIHLEGRWWMYYSVGTDDVGHHLRAAVASSPTGPFRDSGVDLTPGERFAIDPHPFVDADGTVYLYFARDVLDAQRVGTHLAVDVMATPTELAGSARSVLEPDADWQLYQRDRLMYGGVYDWHTLEGPTVVRRRDRYYCLYSGGSWRDATYAVSWAVADHPLGPWRPAGAGRRLLRSVAPHVLGPGHNSTVTTPGGQDLLVYHAWDEAGTARRMCIDPVSWREDGPWSPGPTWTEQPLPG